MRNPTWSTAGRSVVAAAAAQSIPVRLIGGVAIWLRASPAARAALGRTYPDIDLVAHKKQSRKLRAVLEEEGFEPERVFNATHGARRLLYHGPGGWQVDIFLDTFEMSHTLDLGTRLEAEPETLAAAELLLTKLQIAEVNAKDLSDTAMLLWDHEPASADGPGLLNLGPVVARCAADWGLYTTVTDNLAAGARAARLAGSRGRRPRADRGADRGDHRRAGRRAEVDVAGSCARRWAAGSAGTNCLRRLSVEHAGLLTRPTSTDRRCAGASS